MRVYCAGIDDEEWEDETWCDKWDDEKETWSEYTSPVEDDSWW